MGRVISYSICALFVLAVVWTPAHSNDACSAGCKGGAGAASFQAGHKYTYAVEGEVDVYLTAADKQQTTTKLNAQISVAALGNCALVLRVTNLQLTGPDGKKYGKPVGIEKPVRFTLQDGLVGGEICTEEGDNQRSINIKRAIISLLGSSIKPTAEVDVFGVCPTEATWSREGGAVLVHRARDLRRCAFRETGKHDLVTSIYNPKSEIKSTNILQSSLNVESKVKNGVPEKVSATEEYLYTPFSVGQNGARARVVTKLTLSGQSAGADTGAFKNVKSIIFENPHPVNTEHSNQLNVLSALKSTAQSLQGNAGSNSAGIFAQLVKIFRVTNKEDLLNVFNQIKAGGAVKDNKLAKKVFLDALLRAGTGESIEVSIKLLQDKELSDFEQKLVLMSLGNARHATNEAVVAVAALLDQPNLPREAFLGAGALAGAYCREHACHGHTTQASGVAALAAKFAAKIGNCHTKSKHDEDQLVSVLKGVRNVRHIEHSLRDKLAHCVSDAGVKARVQVAALEAFHADPCISKLKKTAIDTMKNRQLDSEIRIKAYLALLDCPCAKVATEVKTLLDTEPVQQVGRFITSSLRFIRASTNPDRELVKYHLGQIRSPQKFNVDDRKYSHYRELSYSIDSLGVGASAEQAVIFSQDSFLPRSLNLNLTTEVFGYSFNLIDVAVRQGNLDRVLEHFFGPKGYFKSNKPQEVYDTFVKKISEIQEKLNQHLRGRRAVQQEIANFAKQVKGDVSSFHDELDLDIYVKIFGTDAIFLSLGDDKGFSIDAIIEKVLKHFDAGAKDAKHFSHELRSHVLFLDAELTYPTSVGLPLKLNLVGSATGRIEVAGSFDIKQIIKNPGDAKVELKVVPSTNIEVAGTFVVDADVITTGLKVVSSLHTSTGGHVVLKVLDNGKGVDLQLGLPVEKEELLTVANNVVFVTNEKGQQETEVPLKIVSDRTEYKGCFDQLSGAIGLTFCGLIDVPFKIQGPDAGASFQRLAARYPLTGPSKLSVHLEKNDLKNYHIKGLVIEEGPRRGFDIVLEAEGAKSKRRTALSGEYIFSDAEKKIKLNLESPIKSAGAEISFINNQNELSGHVNVKHDAEEYFGRVGFKVAGNSQRSVYTPLVEYKLPGCDKKTLQVEGQVVRESQAPSKPGHKYSFNGIKINMPDNNEKINIDGYVANEPRGVSGELKAVKGDHKLSVKGAIDGPKYNLEFQNTLNPFVNFKADLYTIKEEGHVQNDLKLVYGSDLNSKTNKVSFNQNLKYDYKTPRDFNVITKNQISCPALQIEGKFEGEFDPKKINIDVETKYQDRKANLELEARTEVKKPGDYIVKFDAGVDDKGVEFFSKRDIISADKSNLENVLTIKPGGKYELSGVVNHKVKPHDVNIGAVGQIKIAGKDDDIKFDAGVVSNPKEYSVHSKISAGASELVNFLLKLIKSKDPHGELKLNLKDAISANGQFHLTSADGKGNGVLIVDFKRLGKKLKGDTKFVSKAPNYSADIDLFLDFEKDNNNKIHFSTNTVTMEGHYDTKNVLDLLNKKYQLNAKSDYSGELKNRKVLSEVTLELPERTLTFELNRDLTDKNQVINGNVNLLLTDKPKSGELSSLSYKSNIANLRKVKDLVYFNFNGQLDLIIRNGKKLTYTINTKHNTDGTLDFKTDLSGNIIPKPASLSGNFKYKIADNNEIDGVYKTHLKGNYGSDASFLVDVDEDVQLINSEDKKYVGDYSLQLNLPIEKAHDIKLTGNIMFLLPNNKEVLVEYNLGAGASINADSYKVDSAGKVGLQSGFEKIKIIVPNHDPFTFDTSYKLDKEGKRSGSVEIKSNYGKGKSATVALGVARPSAGEYSLSLKAHAPGAEKLKNLEISIVNKNPEPNTVSSLVVVEADGRVYKLDASAHYSRVAPLLELKYSAPDSSKPSRLYAKGSNLNEHGGHVEVKIENIRDFDLDYAGDIRTGKDGISIKMNIDAPKLKLVKYQQDITTKDSPNGKRLEFHTTNNGKNVVSGSTSYISKQEGSKTIMEGSGTLKVNEEQKSATFKYIRDVLTEGQEQGIEEFMNLVIGERSIVLESRITNLEYKLSNVYCEEKKQCAHAELNSKIVVSTPGLLQHTVNIGLDLRKLGFSPEFGLQMSSEVSEHKLPQYLLDVHLNQEQNKYHLHAYSQPKNGAFPAGITLTLPKRVIALESSASIPEGQSLPFPLRGDVAFYLNKNQQPKQKAAVRLFLDLQGSDKERNAVAELGFYHPALDKEALLNFKASLARPAENSLRVESFVQFSHPAFGSDKKSTAFFEVSPKSIKLKLVSPLVEVVNVNGNADIGKDTQNVDVDFTLLQGKPVHLHFAANNFQSFEFTTGYKDHGGKLSVVGRLEPEKRVELSTDLVLPSEKKNIFKAALSLQDNTIKPEYSASLDNFKYFTGAVKNDLLTLGERLKQLAEQARADAKANVDKAAAALQKVADSYKSELSKLKEEVINDKTLQDLNKALHSIVHMFAVIANEIIEATAPIVAKINEQIQRIVHALDEFYKAQLPNLKKLFDSVSEFVQIVVGDVIDVFAEFVAVIQTYVEKYKPQINELVKTIAEIFKDLSRLLIARLKELRKDVGNLMNEIIERIKNLPVIEMLKEKIAEFQVPEQALAGLEQLHVVLKDLLPTPESKNLADAIFTYANKKLRQLKVDDQAELRVIYEKLVSAFYSLVSYVRGHVGDKGLPSLLNLNLLRLNPVGPAGPVPLLGSASFSPLNYLRNGDFPSPLDIIRAYRPRGIPLATPAKLTGVVVNGQHIFTFDGRHLTFPGSCRYVLAHDHGDGNFTLALQLQNGQPKSIVLSEKSGQTIEIKENGQVALNGANHGYPIRAGDAFAFRMPNGGVGMGSRYGVMVLCSPKLTVCHIEVNGFYLGKLRGLLGDGNHEEFDDFRLPNGKIGTNEAEFGNAYRLASSCPHVKTPEHGHEHGDPAPACELVFGGSSPLRPFFLLQDPKPFRQACAHATSANPTKAQDEACDLGRAFAAKLGLPAALPGVCLKCHDGDKTTEIGEVTKYEIPKKQADIIVAIELTKGNEQTYKDLVVPLVGQIVEQLKSKKVDDLKVYLIGVTSEMPYAILYDIENVKLKGGKPQFTTATRVNHLFEPINTSCEKLNSAQDYVARVIDRLQLEFGISNVVAGYNHIGELPLRPGAIKTVISVVSETCKKAALPLQSILSTIKGQVLKQQGVTNHLITVTPDLKVGAGAQPSQIIGFDKSSVVFGDKKHKNTEEIRSTLELVADACIDFVQETGGSVFSATNYHAAPAPQRKQFLQAAAHNVVDKLLKYELETSCRCVPINAFWAKSVCVVLEKKEAARRR